MINIGNNFIEINNTWSEFKSVAASKALAIQYVDDSIIYTIFAIDGSIVYITIIYKGTVPAESGISQGTNDSNKSDFETNYKSTANSRITDNNHQISIFSNDTITVGGSKTFSSLNNRQANLFINVKNSPSGTNPGLQFTLQEVDPGDQTTVIGTTITGLSITAAGTQAISLNLTTSSTLKISWIIVGTDTPTFTGVYVTLTSKPTTTISGVDTNGVERTLRPDTSGRLLVSGSNAIGAAVTVDPLIIGGVNPGGVAGYAQLASDNSLIVNDGGNYQPVFLNGTITSSSISNLKNVGDGTVFLFINIKNAPTGTNPTLTFKLQELDPGDQSTALRASITGTAMTAAGTKVIVLPNVSSGVVQVQWTIGGTNTPTFTGVYVTTICKTGVSSTDLYGDLYTSALNSMVFEANTATAGVAPGTSIGTGAAFALYNPTSSTKNLVVQKIGMSYVSGTLGSGSVYLCANTNPAASAVTGTSITPVCTLIGGASSVQGQAFTTATLPASPTVVKSLWTLTPMLATSVLVPFVLEEITLGRYVIIPGCSLSLEAVAGNGSAPRVTFNMTWAEVPF